LTHDEAATFIVEGKGRHFDPDVVDAFSALADEFKTVAARWPDEQQEISRVGATALN
jgi:putative two-component system response regulator